MLDATAAGLLDGATVEDEVDDDVATVEEEVDDDGATMEVDETALVQADAGVGRGVKRLPAM